MPDLETIQSGMSDRELAARLIRMGAIPPVSLDLIDREKIEDIVAGLPTMYGCRYSTIDAQGGALSVECFDLTPEGLNRQMLQELAGKNLQAFPERQAVAEYSPEAWKGYLQRDFESVDRKPLLRQFRRWGMPLDSKRVRDAFCKNPELNEKRVEELLHKDQSDILSRLVRMGVVEPMDIDHVSIQQADEIIKSLPALTESEIVWRGEDDFERKRFVNLAEFHVSKHGFHEAESPEFDEGVTDDDLRIPLHEEERPSHYAGDGNLFGPNVRSGAHTLHMQERRFLSAHEGLEEQILHRREEITGGYAWLDYFRQGKDEALPGGNTTALRNAFKTWGIALKRGDLELGFSKNTETNRKEAMLSFYKSLFSKTVNAGIVEMMPKNDWYTLDLAKAEVFAAKIPLLPEMNHPGEWLDFFRQAPPATALEIVQLENRFNEAGIPFDEELVCSSFPKPKGQNKTMKGTRKMQDLTIDDYKKMIGRLTSSGRMERLDNEEFKNLSIEDAKDYVRGFDMPASDKQKVLLQSMADEGRIEISEQEIGQLSKQEASFIVDHAPQQSMTFEKPEHPITDETRRELKRLIDNGETPQIPWARFNNLSEEDGRQKIDQVYARRPATEKQKEFIHQALESGSIPKAALVQIINKPTIRPEDVYKLNQLQASRLIGSMPASEKQIAAVKRLVEEKRIEPMASYDLSASEANKILDKAYREGPGERDPNGPATPKQKETLLRLAEQKLIPAEITPDAIEKMSFADAGAVLENAPASRAQKDMIVRFVHEEKLPHIPKPELANMKRGTASLLIDVGQGKRPQTDLPKFEEIEYPASESQMQVLNDLREKGKIQEIPENVTRSAASQMINEAFANDPIAPQQMAILEKKIANNQIPNMTSDEKAKLTQGDFARLMKESRSREAEKQKAPEAPSREHTKNKARTRQGAGMSR